MLASAIGIGGCASGAGYWPCLGDLSPEFSQILVGISNSIASIPGIVGGQLVGSILHATHDDWGLVFKLAAAVEVAGAFIFVCFCSAEDQRFGNKTAARGGPDGTAAAATDVKKAIGFIQAGIDERALLGAAE